MSVRVSVRHFSHLCSSTEMNLYYQWKNVRQSVHPSILPSIRSSVRPYVRMYVHNRTQCSHKPIYGISRGRQVILNNILGIVVDYYNMGQYPNFDLPDFPLSLSFSFFDKSQFGFRENQIATFHFILIITWSIEMIGQKIREEIKTEIWTDRPTKHL